MTQCGFHRISFQRLLLVNGFLKLTSILSAAIYKFAPFQRCVAHLNFYCPLIQSTFDATHIQANLFRVHLINRKFSWFLHRSKNVMKITFIKRS